MTEVQTQTPKIQIVETTVSSYNNVKALKKILKRAFSVSWKKSTPYKHDDMYVALVDDKPVGLMMVHESPPYKFSIGSGFYAYNVAVDPSYQGKKIGSALLSHAKTIYSIIHVHCDKNIERENNMYITNGFVKQAPWQSYIEYTWNKNDTIVENKIDYSNYDPVENIIYMS